MKTKILSIATATFIALGATSANASMYAAVGTADFDAIDATEYTVGISGDLPLTHNFLVGIGVNVGYIDLNKPYSYAHDTGGGIVFRSSDGFGRAGMDIKLGYTYKDVLVYGMGSVEYHNQDQTNWYALGYGGSAGIEYKPFEHVAFGAEYKTYSMEAEQNAKYDYSVTKALLKYYF